MQNPKVICIHIGARAHYLIPKSLQQSGALRVLITDTWTGSVWVRKLLSMIPVTSIKSLAGRYSSSIPSARVYSFGVRFLFFELLLRLKYAYSWESTLLRDQKFETEALRELKEIPDAKVVVGISYTALKCFEYAKSKGIKTVLYQMDPGFEEEELVDELIKKHAVETTWHRAPRSYWDQWKKECELSDVIFVNSEWSRQAIVKQGIEKEKIKIIPLPYSIEKKHTDFKRIYLASYSKKRPLRCLFLGTLTVRKGIHLVIEAAKQLADYPVEFIFIGRNEIEASTFALPNIQYKGVLTREEVDAAYKQADVFLFPTLSDGFGLTQLEAMAWQLPVIASKKCGDVVKNNYNGWQIDVDDSSHLVAALQSIVANPAALRACALNCIPTVELFDTDKFASDLVEII